MDNAAATLLEALEKSLKADPEQKLDLKTTMAVMEQCSRWLEKRSKLRPEEDPEEGVHLMRKMMDDPGELVERFHDHAEFRAALERRGWLPPLPKHPKGGRPPRDEAAYRETLKGLRKTRTETPPADDSELRRMLNGGTDADA